MSIEFKITIISTIVSTTIAIIALFQSFKQLKLNNKQHLFDKRIENYIVAKGLLELYRENKEHIEENKKEEPYFCTKELFVWLANNSYLESIIPVIDNDIRNLKQKEFLIKMEELKNISIKTNFLFDKKIALILGEFINSYQKLLKELYKYQLVLNSMGSLSEKSNLSWKEASKKINEIKYRRELYEKFDNLVEAYKKVDEHNVEETIEKQIKVL